MLAIGNLAFQSLARLLRRHGFAVMERYDLECADFLDALEEFRDFVAMPDVVLVFYLWRPWPGT